MRDVAYTTARTKKTAYKMESAIIAQYIVPLRDFDAAPSVVDVDAAPPVVDVDAALLVPGDPAHVPSGQQPASHPYWIPFSWYAHMSVVFAADSVAGVSPGVT